MNLTFATSSAISLFAKQDADSAVKLLPPEEETLRLFDLWRQSLLRYALHLGLCMHDSEDVLQETFLALFEHLRKGKSRENLRAWLFRVTHNLALKRRIAVHTENKVAASFDCAFVEFRDAAPGPEEALLFSERKARLIAVMNALPENDQWCLRLRAEGLRYREIADVLGIALGSVSNSLTRSLSRLQAVDER